LASLYKETDRIGYRLAFMLGGKRKKVNIPDNSKRRAQTVERHVEELLRAQAANEKPEPSATLWADALDGKLRTSLERLGLIVPRVVATTDRRTLEAFVASYVSSRTDIGKATTFKYNNTKRFLLAHFGADKPIADITRSDAKAWQRWLLAQPGSQGRTMAESTVSKHVKRTKTMFQDAVDARLLTESPFDALKAGDEVNRDRDYFLTDPDARLILDTCPDNDWRLAFALLRWGAMRPCEILTLTWTDVLWSERKLRIDSPKTGVRHCPIFPEVMPHLEASFNARGGNTRCLQRFAKDANLGTHLARIIERAGLVPWEKLLQNLRATRRTELQESFPDHVLNAWLGQSTAVARKHYLQVTDEHWQAGMGAEMGQSTPVCAGQGQSAKTEKSLFPVLDFSGREEFTTLMPPQGPQQDTKTRVPETPKAEWEQKWEQNEMERGIQLLRLAGLESVAGLLARIAGIARDQ